MGGPTARLRERRVAPAPARLGVLVERSRGLRPIHKWLELAVRPLLSPFRCLNVYQACTTAGVSSMNGLPHRRQSCRTIAGLLSSICPARARACPRDVGLLPRRSGAAWPVRRGPGDRTAEPRGHAHRRIVAGTRSIDESAHRVVEHPRINVRRVHPTTRPSSGHVRSTSIENAARSEIPESDALGRWRTDGWRETYVGAPVPGALPTPGLPSVHRADVARGRTAVAAPA